MNACIFGFLVCFLSLGCSAHIHTHTPESIPGQELLVATYNIRHGVGTDGKLDLSRALEVIRDLDIDVIALQEVDEKVSRSGGVDQAQWLAKQLNMYFAFGSFMPYQGGQYGLAILSKFPIASYTEWRLTDGNEPRVALAADIVLPNSRLCTAVAVHFDWVKDDGFRFTQAAETIGNLESCELPWIVFGDFNDVPQSRTMQAFYAIGKPIKSSGGELLSFPAENPEIAIDSIIVGPPDQWAVSEGRVINEPIASDHRPVRGVLWLRNLAGTKRTKN